MKKGLILCLALVMAFAMVAQAKVMDPRTKLVPEDGDARVAKTTSSTKAPSIGLVVGATGYADAWRGTVGMAGKSIVVDPTGTYLGMAYGSVGKGALCNVEFAFSQDGGASWEIQRIASGLNIRIYNGIAFDADLTPYIVWQNRGTNSIQWSKDEGGLGGGFWMDPYVLAGPDSVAWYIPSLAIGGTKMMMSSFANNVSPAGDLSIHAVLSNDLGATWQDPWGMNPLPYGWNKWSYNEIGGQGWNLDEPDWMFSGSGDTVVSYIDVVVDTALYVESATYAGFYPAYKLSFDGGITWSAMKNFSQPPQYNYGGWWYLYDGAWIGDRPYFLYVHQDGVWNGGALFEMHPTVAGDFSTWTRNRISDLPGNQAGVIPGELNGGYVDCSSLSYDAAGNIYAIYQDYPKDNDGYEFFGVASTDGGTTWLNPVRLTNEMGALGTGPDALACWLEVAEFAGGDKIHMIFHDPVDAAEIYYWNVPTSTILAGTVRPEEITIAPKLVYSAGGGWGGPIDATMDTVSGIGDALVTYWSPIVAEGGTYQVQLSRTPDFSTGVWEWADAGLNVNYLGWTGAEVLVNTLFGLPEANVVWYWRVRSHKGADSSPWSEVYDFYYKGTTVNTTDWIPSGVEGTPTGATAPKFSLNQNRPNPVNKLAELSFTLPKSGNYSLKIYNIAGQMIRTLDGKGVAGQNTVTWNGLDNSGCKVANGVYLYTLNAFGNSATKKLVVVR